MTDQEFPVLNTKDYEGGKKRILCYGPTGSGKSTAFLTMPGKKFAYIFDPSGLEAFAGHDIDYMPFLPEMKLMPGKLGKGSKKLKMLTPDPSTYQEFEEDIESRLNAGFFDQYDVLGFESFTTLMQAMMYYILDSQGRSFSAPEIADYYYRSDGMGRMVRTVNSLDITVFASAHSSDQKDEVTQRIEWTLAMSKSLKVNLPLLFSDIIPMSAETDKNNKTVWTAQFRPTKKTPICRTSIKEVRLFEDVTVDWDRPLEGQGLGGVLFSKPSKTEEEVAAESVIDMGGGGKDEEEEV